MKNISAQTVKTLMTGAGFLALCFLSAPATAQADQGRYCREYTRTVWIDGRARPAYGVACLQPDGAWRIVNEDDEHSMRYNPVVLRERVIEPPPQIIERVIVRPARPVVFHSWNRGRHIGHHEFYSHERHRR